MSSVEGVSRRSLLPCSSPDCPQPFLPCCPAPLVFRRRTTAVRTTMRMCLWRTFERALTALLPASTCALVKATTPQHKHSTTAMSPLRQRPRSPPLPLSFAARPCGGAARKELHNTNKAFFATHPSTRPRPTLPGSRPSRAASVCCRPLTRSHLSDTLLPSDLALHALFSPPAPLELPAPGSAQCGRPLSALQAPAPSPACSSRRAPCGPSAGPRGPLAPFSAEHSIPVTCVSTGPGCKARQPTSVIREQPGERPAPAHMPMTCGWAECPPGAPGCPTLLQLDASSLSGSGRPAQMGFPWASRLPSQLGRK
jgi:hypothetical protein